MYILLNHDSCTPLLFKYTEKENMITKSTILGGLQNSLVDLNVCVMAKSLIKSDKISMRNERQNDSLNSRATYVLIYFG